LKDLGVLETTKGFNNTLCIIACLVKDLRNKESQENIIAHMDCVALLTFMFDVDIGTSSTRGFCSNNEPRKCIIGLCFPLFWV
jgi:hypothetical protein